VNDLLLFILGLVIAAMVVALALTAYIAWRIWHSEERSLSKRIRRLPFRDKIKLGFGLFADERAPAWSRILVVALTLYLALPIDLIPDFIPFLGFLDDFVIVLLAAGLIIRSIPGYVVEEHLTRIETESRTDEAPAGSRDFDGTVISRHDGNLHDPARDHR
jgi:uncharacterized membrane protein YkvA (DUF1232 family)